MRRPSPQIWSPPPVAVPLLLLSLLPVPNAGFFPGAASRPPLRCGLPLGAKLGRGRWSQHQSKRGCRQPPTRVLYISPTARTGHEGPGGGAAEGRIEEKEEDACDDWDAGDIDSDLRILKSAIAKSRARDERKELERMRLLDDFARRRIALSSLAGRYAILPGLIVLLSQLATRTSPAAKVAALSVLWVNDSYFWTSMVASPILTLFRKVRLDGKLSKAFPPSGESRWAADHENPKTSCRDHLRCLLENWTSSVCGIAAFGVYASLSFLGNGHTRPSALSLAVPPRPSPSSGLLPLTIILLCMQLITRLGVLASLNQFPQLLFQMEEAERVRPVEKYQTIVPGKVRNLSGTLPLGITFDLVAITMALSRQRAPGFISNAISARTNLHIAAMLTLIAVGPLAHLWALSRIVQVKFFTDASLSTKSRTVSIKSPHPEPTTDERRKRFKWRAWLRWRKPERIRRVLRTILRDDFILRGFGKKGRYDSNLFESLEEDDDTDGGIFPRSTTESRLPILQQYALDEERGNYKTKVDRMDWITHANERMQKIHQRSYEKKDFDDYLGIAVQQTLDLGLDFDFDHDTRLKEGEEPSLHRLRARAAKSAVRWYNSIPDRAQEYLDSIEDLDERKTAGDELAERAGEKVESVVETLFSLIPTNAASPKEFSKIKAISESDALSLRGTLPQGVDSMVTSKGEVSSFEQSESALVDPFLDEQYREELVRASREKIAAETSEAEADARISDEEERQDRDAFASDWLERKKTGTDDIDTQLA